MNIPDGADQPAHRQPVRPLSLPEVMLPNGTLLTDFDPSQGGWHEAPCASGIGKEPISHGIDNANYGINSTAGEGAAILCMVAQLAAHNSRGGQRHPGARGLGGGGIVTLDSSLGNEFSHEVGHNYGLGHYVGGFTGSVHRSAEAVNRPGAGTGS